MNVAQLIEILKTLDQTKLVLVPIPHNGTIGDQVFPCLDVEGVFKRGNQYLLSYIFDKKQHGQHDLCDFLGITHAAKKAEELDYEQTKLC